MQPPVAPLLSRLASNGLASCSLRSAASYGAAHGGDAAGCRWQAGSETWPAVQLEQRAGFRAANKPKGGDSQQARAKGGKGGGPKDMEEGNPRLKAVLDMLTPPELKELPPPSKEDKAREAKYHRLRVSEGHAWNRDMAMKHRLQQAALRALPKHLREKAMQPDLTPFPPNRKYLFDTPPEAYRDP